MKNLIEMENIKEQFARLYMELNLTDDQSEMVYKLQKDVNAALGLAYIINRLKKLQRFDLAHYRDGEYGIETEREENDNGGYVDSYEIDLLIKDLTNGL